MAVKLEDTSVGLLLSPLSLESHHQVIDIHIEGHNGLSIVEGGARVGRDLGSVVSNDSRMHLEIIFSLLDSLSDLENLKSDGLNSNDLI